MTTRRLPSSAVRAAGSLLTGALAAGLLLVPAAPAQAAQAAPARWASQSELMVVRDPAIDEASGLTRSTYPRRRIWVHNDSGDSARVFCVSRRGRTMSVLRLRGARNIDWEDIAAGPRHRLWVADIGDNDQERPSVQVIRFDEPRRVTRRYAKARTYRLAYPDGAHDAEALMVDPVTAQVYIVTKAATGAGIYRAPDPLAPGRVNVMQRVGNAPATITGADFAPVGTTFVLRNYTTAYVYPRLGARPTVVPLPSQRQGESIGFTRRARALLIGSEGFDQPVWRLR